MNSTLFDALVVVAAWLGGGLVTWGVMKSKVTSLEKSFDKLDKSILALREVFVSIREYDVNRHDVLRRLDRIEKRVFNGGE